ncbi:unnamed protein product [Paramecium pentaurelia]|uniref:Uncharacterized protein n=1 Tax=Paramecium pentaurelia TaxID=43138 RepID=A0A8S1WQL2_9CILI|nr:unnamed protein product [Paramecium pentaurelia]
MSIKIQFLLPNQQHIATKLFDKSISICQIFEDIHLQYDFFDEEYFHLEWSVYSSATNRYIGYETITLQEILPDYQEDTFQIQLVLNYHIGFKEHLIMIIHLKISLMNKYINYKIPCWKVVFWKLAKIIINLLMNFQVLQKQIYQMNNLYQEQVYYIQYNQWWMFDKFKLLQICSTNLQFIDLNKSIKFFSSFEQRKSPKQNW